MLQARRCGSRGASKILWSRCCEVESPWHPRWLGRRSSRGWRRSCSTVAPPRRSRLLCQQCTTNLQVRTATPLSCGMACPVCGTACPGCSKRDRNRNDDAISVLPAVCSTGSPVAALSQKDTCLQWMLRQCCRTGEGTGHRVRVGAYGNGFQTPTTEWLSGTAAPGLPCRLGVPRASARHVRGLWSGLSATLSALALRHTPLAVACPLLAVRTRSPFLAWRSQTQPCSRTGWVCVYCCIECVSPLRLGA